MIILSNYASRAPKALQRTLWLRSYSADSIFGLANSGIAPSRPRAHREPPKLDCARHRPPTHHDWPRPCWSVEQTSASSPGTDEPLENVDECSSSNSSNHCPSRRQRAAHTRVLPSDHTLHGLNYGSTQGDGQAFYHVERGGCQDICARSSTGTDVQISLSSASPVWRYAVSRSGGLELVSMILTDIMGYRSIASLRDRRQ